MSATRLYLHIGRNKTGSTSLQDFCARHAEWLARHGVRYALLGHLADPASGLPCFADQRLLADFARGCGARAVFASNEMFTGFSPDILRSAAGDLAALDVQVMLYMRPYAPWLRSCYSYDTRIGVNGRDFDAYARHTQKLVSIWPPLAIWGEVLGWDRLRVRTVEPADLAGGEIIADCLAHLGVPLPPGYAPARSNAAPHWMAVELLRLVVGAEEAPGWTAPGSLAVAQALHELADAAIAATGHGGDTAIYTSTAQHAALGQLYAEDIARIGAHMGVALAPAPAHLPHERGFLPSAAHIPPAVIAHIAEAAQQQVFARLHPETAEFVRTGPFAALAAARDRLARPRVGTYLRDSVESGATMDGGVAEMVRQDAAHAYELAGRGELAGAIALGTRLVRTNPDLDLLAAMAEWRRDAFGRAEHPPGPAAWPPNYRDPFPRIVGIPEIGAAELTAEILGGAILHHGSLRVNGLVPPQTVAALQAGIDRALVAQETSNNERPVTDPGWYRKLDVPSLEKAREWSQGCGAVWTADCPPMLDATIEALRASGALGCIAELMGERPALSVAKSTLRRVTPGGYHDWHQDGAFLGRDVRSVNVWLALSECGATAPGMDIVGKRLPYVMPTLSHGACFDWTVGQGFVDILAEGGAPVVTPVFGAGDALLFDHLMLHRTSLKAGMVGQRWAIESWFFAPTNYPYDQVPLYV